MLKLLFEVHLLNNGISDGLNLQSPWPGRGKIRAQGEDVTQGKGWNLGKRHRAGRAERLGTKPRAGSQSSGHHRERPTRTVGMVEKDQPRD